MPDFAEIKKNSEQRLIFKFGGSELIDVALLTLCPDEVMALLFSLEDIIKQYETLALVVGGGARARFAQELIKILKQDGLCTIQGFLDLLRRNSKLKLDDSLFTQISELGLDTPLDVYRGGVATAAAILNMVGIALTSTQIEIALMHDDLNDACDAIGIAVTQLNAQELMTHEKMQEFIEHQGAHFLPVLLTSPETIEASAELVADAEQLLVMAGAGEVIGQTTDAVAAEIAWAWVQAGYDVDVVVTTNVNYVYDKDPKKYPPEGENGARAIGETSISSLVDIGVLNLDPDSHSPGGHVIFDWKAARLFDAVTSASPSSRFFVTKMKNREAIREFLLGVEPVSQGTIIHNGDTGIVYR